MELFYKDPGQTMNQFIIKINATIKNKKIAYTARLDPMARGFVPILIGDECKKIDKYLGSNKVYKVKVIKGIQTDSDDALGIIQKINNESNNLNNLNIFSIDTPTKINQKYHYFSTKSLNHRKQNCYDDKYHEVTIYSSKIISQGVLEYDDWKDNIIKQINNIDNKRNFRQEQIINQWNNINLKNLEFIELELHVSSGFFVRQFIRDISDKINYPLMCYDIYRTTIETPL